MARRSRAAGECWSRRAMRPSRACVAASASGTARRSAPCAEEAPTANWMHVEDGKIARIRVTFDPRGLLAGFEKRS
ncbi:hypothetical protein [Streptomyces sp. NPDC018000]|uniref:hypothetical protein n=1 Tax=Streptomyces sp. NPDC018000 TaxID=3365028 RepID=UPI0037B66D99